MATKTSPDRQRGAFLIIAAVFVLIVLAFLGTVFGMLVTFQALAAGSGGEVTEAMAAGISQALFPPEVGLCISLPGLILARLIKRRVVEMDAFRAADFHTGFLDQLLASGSLAELHGRQDPEAEIAAAIAAACLATAEAGGLPDDLFAYGENSAWWDDGNRVARGRFPR